MARVFVLAHDQFLVTVYTQQKKLWEGLLELLDADDLTDYEFKGYYYDDWKYVYGKNVIRNTIKTYSQLNSAIRKSDNLVIEDEVAHERFTIFTRHTNKS